MRKKIFQAFLQLSIGILLALSVAAVLIHQFLKTQDEIKHLENFGEIISSAINNHGWDFLHHQKYEWIRISIIDHDGTMLFDSAFDENKLDNHLDRLEVEKAMRYGESSTRRYSDTFQQQTFYHAIKLNNGQILRLSFTSDSLYLYTQRFTLFLLLLAVLLIVACYYIATHLSRSIIAPINTINLNDLEGVAEPINHTYSELQPFLWRISMQQRKIDEQLQEIRHKNYEFQVITKSMSDGLVILNAEGNIVSINKIARKIFAVTKENCINQSYLAIDNSDYMRDMMANSAKEPKQSLLIVRDGRDYKIRFNKIEDNDDCVGYVLIILDVTDKKRTEQLRQEFTANVSHELKTPLQSIIGYSEMMANGFVQPEDIKHFASRINKQSSRLKTLIEDIIFLSHLDEGQVTIMEPISIKTICSEVFESLQEKAIERMVGLTVIGPDLNFVAVTRYIYELIYNLVDNAIRYNQEGGRVSITLKETDNKYVICVADQGIGIAPEDQYRIFERFYRVDKSHSRQTGGTGLGLSIVKRVVLYHQGKIRITSGIGKGTTFSITFYKDKLHEIFESNKRKQEALLEESRKEREQSDAIVATSSSNVINRTVASASANPTPSSTAAHSQSAHDSELFDKSSDDDDVFLEDSPASGTSDVSAHDDAHQSTDAISKDHEAEHADSDSSLQAQEEQQNK